MQTRQPFTSASLILVVLFLVIAGCNRPTPNLPPHVPIENEIDVPVKPNETLPPTETEPIEIPDPLSADELSQGWISLFDGKSLFGWEKQSDANWRVEDGTIVVDEGEAGLLCTTTEFADYQLKLQFRAAKGTNSGIFLRTPKKPTDPASDCYELNIAPPDNPFPTLSLVKRQKAEGALETNEWRSYEITMNGEAIQVKLDDEHVLEYTDENHIARGFIGLQLNQGKVEFRDIKLRPLNMASLFNGGDLAGWKNYPDMDSEFTVAENGELNVKNGRGQLETEGSYGDFVLQLECISHAEGLNSGIFFRCIPGDVMMGYECQIHNGFKDGNRTMPVDCGTGGFFRRQDARFVMADDLKWFHKTLIVDGAHMSAWVNGIQVSNWTDDRPPHENPRKGLRTVPGTIMIQGHDPTTNLSFRNLKIAETPK